MPKYSRVIIWMAIVISFIFIVTALQQGEEKTLLNLENCYGDISIKVRQEIIKTDAYIFKGCNKLDDIWKCPCNSVNSVIFIPMDTEANQYDIIVEYYLQDINGLQLEVANKYKRTKTYSNINVNKYKAPLKNVFKEFNIDYILVIVLTIFVIIIGFLYIGYKKFEKYILQEKDENNDVILKPKKEKNYMNEL